jgi:ParB family chromosome partitioning protein
MSEPTQTVELIPISEITVLNPRVRNKRVFEELVTSIAHLGLKKPITVSRRLDGSGFDLVCGQGRLEAFTALGEREIPALVVEADEEDCFVMSLVENLARRQHTPLDLVRDIGAMRQRGYSVAEIATKTDLSPEYTYALCFLFEHGEEKLIAGVERGIIPPSIAIEIAKAKDGDVQDALAEAYETKALPGNQLLAIRRIIEQRNASGKGIHTDRSTPRKRVTADSLVRAYLRETERQKTLIKKATLAQSRLLFLVNAMRKLLADEHFATLLRAEGFATMPAALADRLELRGARHAR